MEQKILDEIKNNTSMDIMISGVAGSGKTLTTKKMIDMIVKETKNDILIISFESEYDYLKQDDYPQERIQVINMVHNDSKDYYNEFMLLGSIIQRNKSNEKQLMIVIDGVNYIEEKSYRVHLDNLRNARACNVSIVATNSESFDENEYKLVIKKS
ncbi:DUF87 domain-containing protein [Erysipelothrix sp. HDW6A]|uniref:helicase HerA domain-containing protein n=1 Tax=Erysipelothrix sp. HDW6A TaxID=2714928 RepID=UPI00140743A2|nr:DUF87 domain-containing protein [Erysipelothrix sp. HDW6A]QIK56348.1 DUF87 domain-containing protein [Erysipelothrix sp. HDW6A]